MNATTRPTSTTPLDTAAVVATAGVLVDRVGAERLSLSLIARELGVTQPALYRHVDDLADLWRGLGLTTRALLADELAAAADGRTGDDALRAVARAWRAFAHRHPGRYRSTDRYAVAGDPALEAAAHRTIGVIDAALAGFGLATDERRLAANTVRSALHGFVAFELGDGHPEPGRVDEAFERLVDHLAAAFRTMS